MMHAIRLALAGLFMLATGLYVSASFGDLPGLGLLITAAVIGAYMALNIGANDVANNVGPAVGSLALTLGGAILIAALFEAGGALIAGGDVVKPVKKGIIDPTTLESAQVYIWVMMAALLGAAIWLNTATWLGAPVSTTHSIVGGVMGGAIAAQGWAAVNWSSMAAIASSWVISPLIGGAIAAGFLLYLTRRVFHQEDMLEAAESAVPKLIGIMALAFTSYIAIKGFKHVVKINFGTALAIGAIAGVVALILSQRWVRKRTPNLAHSRDGVNSLFTLPLIFGAALLSFAHGANDVANAVGPLAGVYEALIHGGISGKVSIPLWVMLTGALGLSLGLALFGPKLIRTVGSEITELDRARAFCIALSAAITVLIASQLGLPVSSTHVALGAVFGVGFLREYLDGQLSKEIEQIMHHHGVNGTFDLEMRLHRFYDASPEDRKLVHDELKQMAQQGMLSKQESKRLRKLIRRKLVKRHMFTKIISAWLITVPVSALLGAIFYYMFRGMLMP